METDQRNARAQLNAEGIWPLIQRQYEGEIERHFKTWVIHLHCSASCHFSPFAKRDCKYTTRCYFINAPSLRRGKTLQLRLASHCMS